jgi:hypothetical protein
MVARTDEGHMAIQSASRMLWRTKGGFYHLAHFWWVSPAEECWVLSAIMVME